MNKCNGIFLNKKKTKNHYFIGRFQIICHGHVNNIKFQAWLLVIFINYNDIPLEYYIQITSLFYIYKHTSNNIQVSSEDATLREEDVPATYDLLDSNKLHNANQPWTGIGEFSINIISYEEEDHYAAKLTGQEKPTVLLARALLYMYSRA